MRKKHKWGSADRILFLAILILLAAIAALFLSLIRSVQSQKKVCQSVVELGKFEYNEAFLEQGKKLAGMRSITPVCEVFVRLRTEDYAMDATLVGVDLSEFQMRVKDAQEVTLGSVPALLVGENSLSALTDANGAAITEKKQKEILERYRELTWEYQLADAELPESASESQNEAAPRNQAGAATGRQAWFPCTIAAILSEPQEDIYLDYAQAKVLLQAAGKTEKSCEVTKILLTVQGEENYERAREGIEQGQKLSKNKRQGN